MSLISAEMHEWAFDKPEAYNKITANVSGFISEQPVAYVLGCLPAKTYAFLWRD
jgi:hypothetical protein